MNKIFRNQIYAIGIFFLMPIMKYEHKCSSIINADFSNDSLIFLIYLINLLGQSVRLSAMKGTMEYKATYN